MTQGHLEERKQLKTQNKENINIKARRPNDNPVRKQTGRLGLKIALGQVQKMHSDKSEKCTMQI